MLLVGENDGADFVAHALAHPEVALHPANEETMANALAHGPYDLAVVGGYVGSRGPLILCEAVRVQQKIPVLILLGQETSEKVLAQHKSRNLEAVTYLDFQGWRDPAGSVITVGTEVRESALGVLELEEDQTFGEQWQQSLTLAQEQRDAVLAQQRQAEEEQEQARTAAEQAEAQRAEAEQTETEEEAADHSLEEKREKRDEAPPPFRTKLLDEDLEFMDRMIERTKNVDFRSKLTKSTASDHADAAAQKLRDHIRELEHERARLAFVYRSRRMDFEAYDDAVQRVEEAERNLQAVREESERRVHQVREEAARAQQEMQQHLSAAMAQTQQILTQIQEQSAAHLKQVQDQLQIRDEDIGGLREEHAAQLSNREVDLTNLRAHGTQLQGQLDSLTQQLQQSAAEREQLVTQYGERERAAIDANATHERELRQELEQLNRARSDAEARAGTLNVTLEAARDEITRLQGIEAQKASSIETMQGQLEQLQAQLSQDAQQYQQHVAAAEERMQQELGQLQEGFSQERAQYQQQIAAAQETMQKEIENVQAAAIAERQQLDASFAAERQQQQEQIAATHQTAQAEGAKLNENIAALHEAHKQELVGAGEKLRLETERLQKEFAQEREQQQAELRSVEDGLRQEINRLETAAGEERKTLEDQLTAQAAAHESQLADVEKQWSDKTEQLKQAAGTFSDAYKDSDSLTGEKQAKIDSLEQRLAEKGQELERTLQAAKKGVDDDALERLARRFERGLENVKSQITKQEALLVTAGIPGVGTGSAAAATAAAVATVAEPGAEASGPAPAHHQAWRWIVAQPERLIGVGALGAGLLVTIILVIIFAAISPDQVVVAGPDGALMAPTAGGDGDRSATEEDTSAGPDAEEADVELEGEPDSEEEADAEAAAEETEEAEGEAEADTEETDAEPEAEEETEVEPEGNAGGPSPGTPEFEQGRKALRKELFAALKKKSWNKAIELGTRLREEYRLDWESEYRMAEALQRAKRLDEAVAAFVDFLENNPENAFADDAALNAGAILLEQGKKNKARPYLEIATKSGSKKTAGAAKALLQKL